MFGPAVICYLFLGGLSGGLCVVASVSGLTVPAAQLRGGLSSGQAHLMTSALVLCSAGLTLSSLLLLADAGNVSALRYLFLSARLNYLTLGAWFLVVGMALSLGLAFLWRSPVAVRRVGLVRALLLLELADGAAIVVYTGLFLAGMPAVALWNTPWLTALFAASSLSCSLTGFAALASVCGLSASFEAWLRCLACVDVAVILFEAGCSVGFTLAAMGSDASTVVSAFRFLAGDLSGVWWLGFVLAGLVAQLALELVSLRVRCATAHHSPFAVAPTLCAFVGGISMRYCVVVAGTHPALGF